MHAYMIERKERHLRRIMGSRYLLVPSGRRSGPGGANLSKSGSSSQLRGVGIAIWWITVTYIPANEALVKVAEIGVAM